MTENENFAVHADKYGGYGLRVIDWDRILWRAVLKTVIIFGFYERLEISWSLESIVAAREACSDCSATVNWTRNSVIIYTDKVKYFKL